MHIYNLDNAEVFVLTDGNQGEQKQGQFLGVTLKSTGDTFLVRYCCTVISYGNCVVCFYV